MKKGPLVKRLLEPKSNANFMFFFAFMRASFPLVPATI